MGRTINSIYMVLAATVVSLLSACGNPITKYQEPAAPYLLYFEPERVELPLQGLSAADTVDLKIMVEKVTDLFAFDLCIDMVTDSTDNGRMLQLLSVSEGPMLKEGGKVSTLFFSRYPESLTHITLQGVRLDKRGVTTYESQHMATIRVLPRSRGTISLLWRSSRLVDSSQPRSMTIDAEDHRCRGAAVHIL